MYSAGLGDGAHQVFQIARRVGNAWQNGSADDAGGHAALVELAHGLKAQVGAWGARLQNARQLGIQRGDGQVDEKLVVAGNFAENIEVTEHQVGFRDNSQFEPVVLGQFFQNGTGDAVAALARLVGVGGSTNGDFFAGLHLL